MASLFAGKQLLTKDGVKPAEEVLKNKYVGIYFSAHWCPPCRGFTPTLAKAYTDSYKAKDMEIVFVSSDNDEASFNEYYAEQPWTALVYSDRAGKQELSSKFKVSGIPSFVVVDSNGDLITKNGRGKIAEGEDAVQSFPDGWRPLTTEQMMEQLERVKKDGAVAAGAPSTKYVLLYFSAHWCGPCQNFTPKFAERYKMLKEKGHDFEVVFVSSDRDEAAFKSYFDEMPWEALSYSMRSLKTQLSESFSVSGIPTVIVLEKLSSGKYAMITDDAVGSIASDEDGSKFPYHPPLVWDADEGLGPINELPCVVALCEQADDAVKQTVTAVLNQVAESMKSAHAEPKCGFITFTTQNGRGAQVGNVLRGKAKAAGQDLAPDGTHLLIVDVQGDKGARFEKDLATVSAGDVASWVTDFLNGKNSFDMPF